MSSIYPSMHYLTRQIAMDFRVLSIRNAALMHLCHLYLFNYLDKQRRISVLSVDNDGSKYPRHPYLDN